MNYSHQQIIDKLWEWIDGTLANDSQVIHRVLESPEEIRQRFNKIPDEIKPLAKIIIHFSIINRANKLNCFQYRQLLYKYMHDLEQKSGKIYGLPSYMFTDFIMIEPIWIVKITNGIIQWEGDESCNISCGLTDCPFRKLDENAIKEFNDNINKVKNEPCNTHKED